MGVMLFRIAFGSYLPKSTLAIAPHPRVTEALGIKREREQNPVLLFDENCIEAILPTKFESLMSLSCAISENDLATIC